MPAVDRSAKLAQQPTVAAVGLGAPLATTGRLRIGRLREMRLEPSGDHLLDDVAPTGAALHRDRHRATTSVFGDVVAQPAPEPFPVGLPHPARPHLTGLHLQGVERDLPAMQIQATYHRHREPPSSYSGTGQTEWLPEPEPAGFPHMGCFRTLSVVNRRSRRRNRTDRSGRRQRARPRRPEQAVGAPSAGDDLSGLTRWCDRLGADGHPSGGLGVTGVVDGHAVVAGRERFLADWSMHLDGDPARRQGHRRDRRADTDPGRLGRAGPRPGRRRRHRQADQRRRRSPNCAPSGCARSCDRRQPPRAATVAGQVGIDPDDVIAEVLPADKVDVVTQLQDGAGRGDGRRRRQRRRRPRPSRPRPGHGHRHRRRHRSQRPHPRTRRPARRRRRHPPLPAHAGHDQGQPVLGVRLQRRRPAARRRRAAQPDARRRGDGVLQRLRRHQQPPTPPLPIPLPASVAS